MFKKQLVLISILTLLFNCNGSAQKTTSNTEVDYNITKTEAEWRAELTPAQYDILIEKGTERPHTGKYNLHFESGAYNCAACNAKLFESGAKFKSHCGWPSFDDAIKGTVRYIEDNSLGMKRVEIVCANCGGHLGHVFKDGPTETGLRYCVNSESLEFNSQPEK